MTSTTSERRTTSRAVPQPNALAQGLRFLGDEWAMLIIQRATLGDHRYGEFRSHLGISDAVLTQRLSDLVDAGMLRRAPPAQGAGSSYALDGKGRALWPSLLMVWDWERAWVPEARDLPVMRHRVCGAAFRPLLTCGSCGDTAPAHEIVAHWGPEGGWDRSIPRGGRRRRGTDAGRFPATMGVVGNHWSLAVVVAALWGVHRFGDFQRDLAMSPAVLSERLRTLVAHGLLLETPSMQRPDWTDYRPTPKAVALLPVFAVMVTWGERWFGSPDAPAVILEHRTCGTALRPRVRCDRCRELLVGEDVLVEAAGPSHDGEHAAYFDN